MEETNAIAPVTEESNGNESSDQSSQLQTNGQEEKSKQAEGAKAAQVRRLGEQDFDAIVTVKINGETKEMPLREAIKLNQLESASHAKMNEAAKLMKQVQGIIKMAKSNPKEFLKETGIDPYDFAEATLAEKFEMMNLTPEQKELMEYKQKLKSYEEKEANDRKAREQEQLSAMEAQESQKLDLEIGEAWKESGLPKTKYMVAQIAARMLSASRQGLKDFTAKDAAASVKEEFKMSAREVFSQMDAEAIQETLGKDVLKKLRDADLKRVSGKTSQHGSSQGPSAKPASQAKAFKSEHEWREHLRELAANLKD